MVRVLVGPDWGSSMPEYPPPPVDETQRSALNTEANASHTRLNHDVMSQQFPSKRSVSFASGLVCSQPVHTVACPHGTFHTLRRD